MGRNRILHIITALDTGGAEMMLLRLLQGADRTRWQHSVLSLRDHGSVGRRIEELGVPVSAVGIRGSIPTPGALWRLARAVRGVAPDLIQGWMYHGNIGALVGSRLGGRHAPVLWNIRYAPDSLRLEKRSTAVVMQVGRLLSSLVSGIIYNSHAGATRHAAMGYATARATVIPNGLDTSSFAPSSGARAAWRGRLGAEASTVLVGRFGRYHPMKDYPMFLEAAALLVRERPHVRVVLAGTGVDAGNAELGAAIGRLKLGDVVHLLGEVAAMHELTAALDIACSSSAFGEAFPNVVGEAMSCGVPCVATDVGDSARILGESVNVVPPHDPVAFATACRVLVDAGDAERRRIGAMGRARIEREFSISRVVSDYEVLYERMLG